MWKRIQVFSVVIFLILAVCPLALASSDCDFSYSNYARAVQLHDMGDYDAALRYYNCALEEDPDDAVIPLAHRQPSRGYRQCRQSLVIRCSPDHGGNPGTAAGLYLGRA